MAANLASSEIPESGLEWEICGLREFRLLGGGSRSPFMISS